jgi:hypothetical protein
MDWIRVGARSRRRARLLIALDEKGDAIGRVRFVSTGSRKGGRVALGAGGAGVASSVQGLERLKNAIAASGLQIEIIETR